MGDVEEDVVQRAREFALRDHSLFIAGDWVAALGGEYVEVLDPGNATPLGRIAAAQAPDVDRAVAVARETFDKGVWRRMAPARRGEILWAIGVGIAERSEELAVLESLDNGMPLSAARAHVQNAAACFRYYAGLTDKIFGHTSQLHSRGHDFLGYTLKEPIGVAGLIVPWNAPLRQTVYKVAPALAAGCSIVLKPAEEASLTALRLAEIAAAAGVPAGVFNVVTGNGVPAGARIAEHPDVDKVSFTGSTEVGRSIIRAAAGNLKKLTLELGGKSPLIIFPDADLDSAVPAAAMSIFGNSGQVCSAASRLLVHRSVHDQVVEGIEKVGRGLRLGYWSEPGTQLGPLISDRQRSRVESYVRSGIEDGAHVVGASRGDVPGRGFFFPPTVLGNVNPSMKVFREEIFGPVLAVTPFDDRDEAVAIANDSAYGLAASVFTRDVGLAHSVAAQLRAGRVGINVHAITDFTMPGGGYKESGWGRENGPDAIEPYLEVKAVFTLTGE